MTQNGISVGVVGAGINGVLMGIRLKQAGLDNFVIYEKAKDVGGTWQHNTYPGLHCDVPSHLYSYSFEPNPNWSRPFAAQAEIQAYMRHCLEKYDLTGHLRQGISIETAEYQADEGAWELTTDSGEKIQHRILVSATGGLTSGNLPRVSGLDTFAGLSWHSADWRHDVDLTGKRIAVIGSAASAVQVIPHAAAAASELFVFQRSPNWVMPRRNTPYTEEEKAEFANPDSSAMRDLRRKLYRSSMLVYQAFKRKPGAIEAIRYFATQHMKSAISDPELIAALTPDYDPGCKRLLVSDEYYPALAQSNTHVITAGVEGLTETSVIGTDGSVAEVDIVIFCTGYKQGGRADGRPAMEVLGQGGQPLMQALREHPKSYRGVAIPGFPNYFTMCGINGVVAYSSLFYSAELHADYILRCVQDFEQRGLRSVNVRADVTYDYSDALQVELQEMSWSGPCTNFYLNPEGRNLSFYPGTLSRLRREFRDLLFDDFDVVT